VSLYTAPFVREAREVGVDVEALLNRIAEMPAARVLEYPDGTIQLQGEGTTSRFETIAGARVRERAVQIAQAEDPRHMRLLLGSASFTSLSPFHARELRLTLWGDFVKQYEGGHLRIQPGVVVQPVDGRVNGAVNNLPITIVCRRRFSKKTRDQLAELVGAYLASVRDRGLFDEGPVARVSEEITFFRRVAQFRVDASGSGQNSVNWLILMLIGFSSVNVVTEIYFTEQLNSQWTFENYFGLSKEEPVKVGIPDVLAPSKRTEAEAASLGRTQLSLLRIEDESGASATHESAAWPDAVPHPAVASPYFPILTTPLLEPDNLIVTIFLEELPQHREREPFTDSIRSWLKLGQLGAFGAPGFGYVGEIDYEAGDDSVRFFCDMATVDVDLAIRILVSTLEGWHNHGIVVKGVVLGEAGAR